ncbi:MAG: helix-turn-helix transcriptional regulator [Lachnospiraceae bacterium]|nr:helix-turn-helix transcriptional regulator [Lachnospiraceae bacterium]
MGISAEHSAVILGETDRVMAEEDVPETEYDIIQELVRIRKSLKLTQKDLSSLTGVTQADISRIESGTRNPSLRLVKRLAKGMGMEVKLVPASKKEDDC